MISGSRIKRMVAKEFRQFFRDKLMLGLSIMIPILQTLILSYACLLYTSQPGPYPEPPLQRRRDSPGVGGRRGGLCAGGSLSLIHI